MTEKLWTIDDLGTLVALALSTDYEGAASGRVRDIPDRRTIRYYTTLGLIDRPAEMRGRTALYGPRHLQQLVAIKRLQAQGLSLAEIQQQLVGLPDAGLRKLARVPEDLPAVPTAEPVPADVPRSAFWRTPPVLPQPADAPDSSSPLSPRGRGVGGEGEVSHPSPPTPLPRGERGACGSNSESPGPASVFHTSTQNGGSGHTQAPAIALQGIPLEDGVLLLLGAARPITEEDIQAVRTVAAPLLHLLHRRRLLGPRQERI